jgi:hypothetical protein
MTTTRPLVPTYDEKPFTDEDGLRRYHTSGGDYTVFRNLKGGNLFSLSSNVWEQELGKEVKKIPIEWRSYKDVVVLL